MDQLNKTDSLEINPHTYTQLSLTKEARIQDRKTASSANDARKVGQLHVNQ